MMPPVLHFGYFDHRSLADGRFQRRPEPEPGRLAALLHELFGPPPGRDMPGLGFFDHYGVLSCVCPTAGGPRLPVERLREFVERSECDVVYAYNNEFHLVPGAGLLSLADFSLLPPWELPQ
jgi:hypothetical protein